MTREDIFRMAQEVELINKDYDFAFLNKFTDKVERFAALVASVEREACAKLLEDTADGAKKVDPKGFVWQAIQKSAEFIRARGQA